MLFFHELISQTCNANTNVFMFLFQSVSCIIFSHFGMFRIFVSVFFCFMICFFNSNDNYNYHGFSNDKFHDNCEYFKNEAYFLL